MVSAHATVTIGPKAEKRIKEHIDVTTIFFIIGLLMYKIQIDAIACS
jgi:hypothetical protein